MPVTGTGGLRTAPAGCPGFCREVYRFARLQPMLKAGEQFYLLPEELPSLDGLGVLRVGFPVCEEKKGRLEPCHAAFLTAKPEELVQLCTDCGR